LGFAFILKLVSGKPVVYDVHEDYSQVVLTREWIPGFTKKTLLRLVKFWENFCSGFSVDLVVAATPTIAGNFSAKNVIVVRNFPLEDDFFGISERLTFPLGAECNLIYAGGIEPIRGIRETIRALKTVTGSRLFLLGEFGEKKFENEIKKEQFWSRVDCPGKVDFETVIEYLKKADIGIVCFNPIKRFQESLPVKMFEYMAAGVPVIASNFPAWKEMVEKNKCGICVDPLDPEKIAKAVDYLISQPERALEMGRNGRKAFYREFNWRPEGEKLIAAYGKIVSK
jgi:glycosyltransferase involved in cell wall biosynthesis